MSHSQTRQSAGLHSECCTKWPALESDWIGYDHLPPLHLATQLCFRGCDIVQATEYSEHFITSWIETIDFFLAPFAPGNTCWSQMEGSVKNNQYISNVQTMLARSWRMRKSFWGPCKIHDSQVLVPGCWRTKRACLFSSIGYMQRACFQHKSSDRRINRINTDNTSKRTVTYSNFTSRNGNI